MLKKEEKEMWWLFRYVYAWHDDKWLIFIVVRLKFKLQVKQQNNNNVGFNLSFIFKKRKKYGVLYLK